MPRPLAGRGGVLCRIRGAARSDQGASTTMQALGLLAAAIALALALATSNAWTAVAQQFVCQVHALLARAVGGDVPDCGSITAVPRDPTGGSDPDGEDPDGEDPDGEDPDGEDPDGEDPDGEDPSGGDPGGGDPGGEDPGGEDPGGEDPGGEDPGGEDPGGEDPGGEEPAPDTVYACDPFTGKPVPVENILDPDEETKSKYDSPGFGAPIGTLWTPTCEPTSTTANGSCMTQEVVSVLSFAVGAELAKWIFPDLPVGVSLTGTWVVLRQEKNDGTTDFLTFFMVEPKYDISLKLKDSEREELKVKYTKAWFALYRTMNKPIDAPQSSANVYSILITHGQFLAMGGAGEVPDGVPAPFMTGEFDGVGLQGGPNGFQPGIMLWNGPFTVDLEQADPTAPADPTKPGELEGEVYKVQPGAFSRGLPADFVKGLPPQFSWLSSIRGGVEFDQLDVGVIRAPNGEPQSATIEMVFRIPVNAIPKSAQGLRKRILAQAQKLRSEGLGGSKTGGAKGGPYVAFRYTNRVDLAGRTGRPEDTGNWALIDAITDSKGTNLQAVWQLFQPSSGAAGLQMYAGFGAGVEGELDYLKAMGNFTGGVSFGGSLYIGRHDLLEAWQSDPNAPGSFIPWQSCNDLRVNDPDALPWGSGDAAPFYQPQPGDSFYSPQARSRGGAGTEREGWRVPGALALAREAVRLPLRAGSALRESALRVMGRAAPPAPQAATLALGPVLAVDFLSAPQDCPRQGSGGGGGGGGGGAGGVPPLFPPVLPPPDESDDEPSPSPSPSPSPPPSPSPSPSPSDGDVPVDDGGEAPPDDPPDDTPVDPGPCEPGLPCETAGDYDAVMQRMVDLVFRDESVPGLDGDPLFLWNLPYGATRTYVTNVLGDLAYQTYVERLGECQAFLPAWYAAAPSDAMPTREVLTARLDAAFAACNATPTTPPLKASELPSEPDHQMVFQKSLTLSTIRLTEICAGLTWAECDTGRTQALDVATALRVAQLWNPGAAPGPALDPPALAEKLFDRAVELSPEKPDDGLCWDVIEDPFGLCDGDTGRVTDNGSFTYGALASASHEIALEMGFSPEEAHAFALRVLLTYAPDTPTDGLEWK